MRLVADKQTNELLQRLIETVEAMDANNQRASDRHERAVHDVRAELAALGVRFDRFADSSGEHWRDLGEHWRDLERRVQALESIVQRLVGKN